MNEKELYDVGIILLSEFDKLRAFQNLICNYEGEYVIKSHIYVVNAKSLMGIFSLDLTQQLKLCSSVPNNEELIEKLKEIKVLMEE